MEEVNTKVCNTCLEDKNTNKFQKNTIIDVVPLVGVKNTIKDSTLKLTVKITFKKLKRVLV